MLLYWVSVTFPSTQLQCSIYVEYLNIIVYVKKSLCSFIFLFFLIVLQLFKTYIQNLYQFNISLITMFWKKDLKLQKVKIHWLQSEICRTSKNAIKYLDWMRLKISFHYLIITSQLYKGLTPIKLHPTGVDLMMLNLWPSICGFLG